LGLNVLIKQLQQAFKLAVDHPVYLTVKDIQASCDVAIGILNDMLLYDKIESGLLALELNSVSPWLLIKKCVQPFYVQVSAVLLHCILFIYLIMTLLLLKNQYKDNKNIY
jgi:hypothetical protein